MGVPHAADSVGLQGVPAALMSFVLVAAQLLTARGSDYPT